MNYNEPHGRCPHGEVATGPGFCVMCPACVAAIPPDPPETIVAEYREPLRLAGPQGYPACFFIASDDKCDLCGQTQRMGIVFPGHQADKVRPCVCVECLRAGLEKARQAVNVTCSHARCGRTFIVVAHDLPEPGVKFCPFCTTPVPPLGKGKT